MESVFEINNTDKFATSIPTTTKKKPIIIVEEDTKKEFTQVVEILQNVGWQRFCDLCTWLGSELNDHQWRFLKAVFLERAVARYSKNKLTYVGREGCDFIIGDLNNITVEMKYVSDCLFTSKGLVARKNTKQITLLNSKGTNTHTNLPDKYADYLLIVEMNGAAIISKEKLSMFVSVNGDSLSAIIPANELKYIFTPSDLQKTTANNPLYIKDKITKLIDEIIDSA